MVECFKPFLRHLLTLDLSRPTLRRHRDNLWVLGGEIVRRLQIDSDLRKQPIEQVVGDLIDDEGGPLLSHGEPEAEQRMHVAAWHWAIRRHLRGRDIGSGIAGGRKFVKLPDRRSARGRRGRRHPTRAVHVC